MRISEIPNIGLDNSRSARAPDKRGTPPGNGVMGEDRTHAGGGDQLGVLSNDLNMVQVAVEGVVARPTSPRAWTRLTCTPSARTMYGSG